MGVKISNKRDGKNKTLSKLRFAKSLKYLKKEPPCFLESRLDDRASTFYD